MNDLTSCWLVANAASGSNSDTAVEGLHEALAAQGCPVSRTISFPDEDLPSVADLDSAGIRTLVTYTGDGTLRTILTAVEGWSGAVLVLPGGTTNLLSKSIHGDHPVEEIVAKLAQMKRTRRTCIDSPAGKAVIEVLAGPGAKWSDVRENLREGDVAALASNAVEAASASTGGSQVRIADPALGNAEGYAGVRLTPYPDGLEADGYGAQSVSDYLMQGVALLRRDFRLGPHDELGRHLRLTCESVDGAEIELMLDGERSCGPASIAFSLAELDVDLLSA